MLEFLRNSFLATLNFINENRLKVAIAAIAVLACAFFPPLAFIPALIASYLTFLGPFATPAAFAIVGVGSFVATSVVDYFSHGLINLFNKFCCAFSNKNLNQNTSTLAEPIKPASSATMITELGATATNPVTQPEVTTRPKSPVQITQNTNIAAIDEDLETTDENRLTA